MGTTDIAGVYISISSAAHASFAERVRHNEALRAQGLPLLLKTSHLFCEPMQTFRNFIYHEQLDSLCDDEVRKLHVGAAQIDDRRITFGCDTHDDDVTLQTEPPIIREAEMTLVKNPES